jgi:high-affinity iron transporter
MIPAYILFLREGLEASMIVSILLAAVQKLGRPRDEMRAIWGGLAAALVVSAAGGAALFLTLRAYDGTSFQTIVETFAYLIAVVLLTAMTFWMQRHSRTLKQELTARAAAGGSVLAMGLLTFTSVGREALESVVFMLAFAFKSNGWLLLLGAVLGAASAIALAIAIYRMGARMDYRRFFQVMGLLLLIFAAGLLGDFVQNLQALGWLNIGTAHLWSTARWLSEDSWLGDLLHSFIGYAASPTVLQALAYAAFLAVAGGYFYRMTRLPHRPAGSTTPTSGAVGLGAKRPIANG